MMATPKKITITLLFGLIAAGCMILFTLGMYWAGPQVFLGQTAYLFHIGRICLAAVAPVLEKRAHGGAIDFRPALKTCFGVMVIGLAVQYLFTWLLLNVFDPAFRKALLPVVHDNMVKAYRRFGASENDIHAAVDAEKGQDPFTFGRMFTGLGFNIIIYFLIALLIAATVRTKRAPLPKANS
jgi:ABC-type antimicrobial peptide transport system permease subunit